MLIVQVCDFGNDGDAYYRLHEPSRFLGRLPGITAVDCHFYHRFLPELAERAAVLVLQFVNDWELLSVCARRRAAGKVTVFEANDYFFDLQPWSPIAARWQDRGTQELYLQLLTAADGVQTSTKELARRWSQRGARNVAVFPNHLSEIDPLPPLPERPLTVGWAGSPGHFADWYETVPVLARWLDEHPEVRLAVMSHELAQPFFQLPPARYEFKPFGSLTDYLRFIRGLDIGLAPLLPNDYNRCRSDVKFLEYASQGAAGIYADMEPYHGSVVPGETGLLHRNAAELVACLEKLRTDTALRQRLRTQAYNYVLQERKLSQRIGDRLAWYQSLLAGPVQPTVLPENVLQASTRDGGYLQLPAQEPEMALLDALKKSAPSEASLTLTRLLESHPQYLIALQSQGQLLNDQRDHRNALAYLERAFALNPHSARTLSEIGRAWYRLGDESRARAALEEALRVNPGYLPGWQYLLRLLTISKSSDGPQWAERAEGLFPSCYPLHLLGVQTAPPARAVSQLKRLLDRHAPSFTRAERPAAAAAFRQTILAAIQAAPLGRESVALLEGACAVFPESARLAAELGHALLRVGRAEEGFAFHARALAIRRQAALYMEEFPGEQSPAYLWQFADHIRHCRSEP